MTIWSALKNHTIQHPLHDALVGVVVALVSIPISMGYAQIAGLPAIYGLYGSLLPILVYGLVTTSPQFIVGVDAMPAAMVGTLLTTFSIKPESSEALALVPLVSFLAAVCFLIFYLLKAGRVVKYISMPVMGGFISGVAATIILMQVPKLYGGSPSSGQLPALILNICREISAFNPMSAVLGFGTILILMLSKKLIPKVPMSVLLLLGGLLLQILFRLDLHGVKLLPQVVPGLPELHLPDLSLLTDYSVYTLVLEAVSIAAVIMAQTLLATQSYASKYDDVIDKNRELLAYSAMNMAASLVGCCPVNGSVSRSGIADSYKGRSQLMSLSASLTMAVILLFGTPLLRFMPVPVLTAIVIFALMNIIELDMFLRLVKYNKNESLIFLVSFFGVLLFGTIKGVVIGCFLSFSEITVRSVNPPTTFVGRIPGQGNYHSISRNRHSYPISHTLIYRFSGNLFFANIDKFENDILSAIKPDTRQIVIDARGIGNIDITALDRLVLLIRKLNDRGIKFYITEHDHSLNDMIRAKGFENLIDSGVMRRRITFALSDAGLEKPYQLEGVEDYDYEDSDLNHERLAEAEWLYGHEEDPSPEKKKICHIFKNEFMRKEKK